MPGGDRPVEAERVADRDDRVADLHAVGVAAQAAGSARGTSRSPGGRRRRSRGRLPITRARTLSLFEKLTSAVRAPATTW